MRSGIVDVKPTNKDTRRIYQEPRIEKVELIADEAVLTNCKGIGQFGKNYEPACKPGTSSCKFEFGS
jgi:hypothetical protein